MEEHFMLTMLHNVSRFRALVEQERIDQWIKFGDQRHLDGTGSPCWAEAANDLKAGYKATVEYGLDPTWRQILHEEVMEAFAESDVSRLREELVQVAAVCAAWIYDLDRR